MRKILVTGGLGFIGSNFIRYLRECAGYNGRIINVDAMTYAADEENLKGLDLGDFETHKAWINDDSMMDAIIRNEMPDVIVNFAAESHVDRSIESSAPFVTSNIVGVQVLLDKAVKYGVERFVQISTDEVYGDLGWDSRPSIEGDVLRPSSPYSASKAAAEHMVNAYARTHGLDTVITRCSNNYGPRQYPEKLVPVVIRKAKAGEKIPVYGDGENVRDWIYVTDHCRGIWKAIIEGESGETYNFGGSNEVRNIDLVDMILGIVGSGEIEFVKDRPGHDLRYSVGCTKSEAVFGWRPLVDFNQGMQETVDWYNSSKVAS